MHPSSKPSVGFAVVILTLLFAAVNAQAQSTATLTGTLTDPSGAAISNAVITAERQPASSGASRRTTSGRDGRFTLALEPGRYRARVEHPSFTSIEEKITLAAGERREWNPRLVLEPLASTVVVTAQAEPAAAEATPAPVDVVTRQEIEQRQATSLPDVLSTLPGISIARTGREGGVASLFLDGGSSKFTKVLVDGTPVNEPGGAIILSSFTLDNIEKIEVVHGAESALFGSDAMTGVVQIFTHRGTTSNPHLTLLAEGGNFSTARGAAQWSGVLGKLDYSAAAAYFQTAGEGTNNFFLNRTLSGNFGWRFSETNQVRLAVRHNTSDAGVAGQTLITPPNLDQHNGLQNFSANLSWEFQTGAHWRHRLAGTESYQRQLFENRLSDFFTSPDPFGICTGLPRSPQAVPSQFCDFPFVVNNQFNRAGLSEQSSYFFRKGAVTAGYQYEVENAFLGALNNGHARRNNQGGFVDARWQPLRRLTLSAGFRAEGNASFGTRVVPRAGLTFLLHDGRDFWGATRLRFSFGQGIKEPRLDQSFGSDPCFPGNPDLRPERSRTINAGVEQRLASDRLRISADYFDNRFHDIVSFTFCLVSGPCPTGLPPACPLAEAQALGFGTYFNTDLARARGTRVVLEAKPMRWLRVTGNYTYNNTLVLKSPNAFDPAETPGNRLIRQPLHSGNVALNASFHRVNGYVATYVSGRRTDSDFLGLGLTSTPGYARFDLATSYNFPHGLTLFGRVENLLDKQYQETLGFPALGREFRVGMKFAWGRE